MQANQYAKIMIDRNNPLNILCHLLFSNTVDVHALVTARTSENGEHTLLRGQFEKVKHSGITNT